MSEIKGQYSSQPNQLNSEKPLLRIEGAPICAVIIRDGVHYLQFKDKWQQRVIARGGNEFIEISLSKFCELAKETNHVGI